MSKTAKSRTGKGQSLYLPVLLCFLPLLSLNFAISFLAGIDTHWKRQEQKELAQQEVEALAAGSDFPFQFARRGGDFIKAFRSLVEAGLKPAQLASNLQQRSEKIFRWPFPQYELFLFHIPDSGANTDMLLSHTDYRPSRRAFCRAFEHLVRINRGEKMTGDIARQNDAMVAGILGGEARSDIMARTQRGRPSFAFYRFFPHWFMWDFFEVKGKGSYGLFLFTRSDETRNFSGKLLSLRDLREQKVGYGAFIPLFRGFGGLVVQSPLQRSGLLKDWVREKVSQKENDLKKWLHEGVPPVTQLGNFNAYSYLGKGQSHLAVLLMPVIKDPTRPLWLFFINLFAGGSLILLLIRGWLLGAWPDINLRLRFILTYLLAATLPVSMLIITAYGYVTQYRRAIHFQTVSQLQFCIKQFDARKAQILDEYKSAFTEAVIDEKFRSLLKEQGPTSAAARDRVTSIFRDRPQPLPLLSFAIMDETGEGIREYSGHTQAEGEPTFEAFKFPLVSALRKKILATHPGIKLKDFEATPQQTTSIEAYKSISGNDLIEEVDKRRSFPITRQLGMITATQMHELIKIDGQEKYALMVVWDDQALDVKTFKHSVDYFGLNNPGFIFVAYRISPQGLTYLYKPDRHSGADFLEKSSSLAEVARFRDSYAGARYDNLSLVAMPSKKYSQTVIAGGAQHFELEQAISYRLMMLAFILGLTLVVVLICSYLSGRLFLDPISDLKGALDKVSAGHLDIEITSSSNDELGLLCYEFSNMAKGLKEREKLATLISDHAIEAMSRKNEAGGDADTDAFSGVALVSDIRNFTGMCEKYRPDEITELLNEHFAQMTRIISDNGGRIYKFIGDAIEAVFPENPDMNESASERAFNAASQMLVRLLQINRQRSKKGLFKYQIGVGLAYGKMFAGSIGSVDTRLDFAIVGDPIKRAEVLEACSVKNPAFPLVIDREICNNLQHKGMTFQEIADREDNPAFILSEIGGIPEAPAAGEAAVEVVTGAFDAGLNEKTDLNRIVAGSGSGFSHFSVFLAGAAFILLIFAGFFWGDTLLRDSYLNRRKIELSADNLRLIEQFKCEDAVQGAFDNVNRRLLLDMENLVFAATSSSDLSERIASRFSSIEPERGKPERAAVFLFDRKTKQGKDTFTTRAVYSHGFSPGTLAGLTSLANLRKKYEIEISSSSALLSELIPNIHAPGVFSDRITDSMFVFEYLNRTAKVRFEADLEFMFYYFLTDDKGEHNGLMLVSTRVDSLKRSLPILLDGYSGETMIGIKAPGAAFSFSGNFPDELKNALQATDTTVVLRDYVINEDSFNLDGIKHDLIVARRNQAIAKGLGDDLPSQALIAVLFVLMLGYWLRISTGTAVLNRSVAGKMWLTLLAAAVVPIITVFYVSELYLSEDQNARMSQERSDLQRFIDLFELRDSFSAPLGWKMVSDWTYATSTVNLMRVINNASGPEEVEPLKKLLKGMTDSWHLQARALDRSVFNFIPRDIAVAGKSGWDFASSGYNKEDTTEFAMMLQQIAGNLASRRNQRLGEVKMRSDAIKGEIVVETGLQTVRSLFGDDVYIKLSHGLGLPIVMNVLSGTAGIIIYPVPTIEKPEYIMVWMVLFDFDGYLARIARNYKGNYLIFPAELHRYGRLVPEGKSAFRQMITPHAAMISASNLPVSTSVEFEGAGWLVEGRPGITQMTSMLMAMAPEEPIRAVTDRNRLLFNLLLLVSMGLILLIARNIAADILEPIRCLIEGAQAAGSENYAYRIRISRSDELGVLCDSFDTMMKGLEEKMLMGRMVSKTALKVSLKDQEQASRRTEYVFLYIGIPDFSTWIRGMSADQLIADLKGHVSSLSRIIMDQGGDVDKIIGDKLLAVFHAERDRAGAVFSACRAAQEIITAENRSQLPFPVAIGMNYGEVITGFLGVGEKRDFTVIGDAVNVTARIEGQAEKLRFGRCLVSQNVYELASRDFTAREFGEVELKGKSLPLKVYQLTI